jgi:hypothetical protein
VNLHKGLFVTESGFFHDHTRYQPEQLSSPSWQDLNVLDLFQWSAMTTDADTEGGFA